MGWLDFLKLSMTPALADLDSPATAAVHRQIILAKPFLKRLYADFYRDLASRLPQPSGELKIVEIGSGAGFVKEVIPNALTSDLFSAAWIDKIFPADKIPFDNASIDAFLLLNVFHHLPRTVESLSEMSRCLCRGGKIVMIEPANTAWQRFVTKRFHHEPFIVEAGWGLEGDGRLTAGNEALPWIVFTRDREIFEKKFPELKIRSVNLHTPLSYIISGGLSYRSLLPGVLYPLARALEWALTPAYPALAMFQTIEIEKAS